MEKTSRVEKVVTKVSIREAKSDYVYWQSQSYMARLAALEEIRREYHRWKFGAEPRLQRVYTIVKR
jgi:hypothetical protein